MLAARIDVLRLVTGGERVLAQAELPFVHVRSSLSPEACPRRTGWKRPAGLSAGGEPCLRSAFRGRPAGGQPRSAGSSSPIENSAVKGSPRCWKLWPAPWPRSTTASTRTTSALYDSAASAAISELSPLVITSSRVART